MGEEYKGGWKLNDQGPQIDQLLGMVAAANAAANGGVAPGGFGLGGSSKQLADIDLNSIKENGFYFWPQNGNVSNTPVPSSSNWGYLFVVNYAGVRGTQIAMYQVNDTNSKPVTITCIRAFVGSTFGAWEYANPPLIAGQEYRTTERFNGKPVYVKVLTSKTSRAGETIYWDGDDTLTNLSDFVGVSGALGRGPLVNGPGVTEIGVDMSLNQLYLVRAAGASTYNARPIVKYTETTN